MKHNRHSLLAKGLMVLLALLIMVFAFTYSWFVAADTPVHANGFSVVAEDSSTDFDYAIGFSTSQTGGAYKHTVFTSAADANLNLEELYASDDLSTPINLLHDYTPTDLTGNGVTLVRPSMNYGNWSINTASSNYSVAEENVQYISFDLIFRTKEPNTTISLDEGSFAKADCETYAGDGSLLTDTASRNKDGKYGAFSTDAIVGAVRVAFLEYVNNGETGDAIVGTKLTEYNSAPKLIWVPRPDIYLNNNPTGSSLREKDTDGWALNTGVTSSQTFNLDVDGTLRDKSNYSTYAHEFYDIFMANSAHSIVTYDDAVASTLDASAPAGSHKVTFGTSRPLVTLNHINDTNNDGVPDDEYYYGKIRVRIWVEGTDSESRRALAGGKFSVSFHITV